MATILTRVRQVELTSHLHLIFRWNHRDTPEFLANVMSLWYNALLRTGVFYSNFRFLVILNTFVNTFSFLCGL